MKKKIFSTLLMGAFFLASMSVFTSCKDYDDDINANKTDIAALKTELATVKSSLESELSTAKSSLETQIASAKTELQNAIALKADASTVSALETKVKNLETDLTAKITTLTTQIETANKAIEALQSGKADITYVDAQIAALTGKLNDETKAREAVEVNLEIQAKALDAFKKEISDADYQKQIDELKKAIENFESSDNIEQMKKDIKELQEKIAKTNENLDALRVLVERALSSIALVPSLYIDGIEAIEFLSLEYTPVKPGTSGLTPAAGATAVRINNGLTEATYRLNPTTVQRDGIDEDNIDFVAAKAETRAAAEILDESPVAFNGIKSFSNGLMTVYLKKNTTESLNPGNDGKITIVSLKVPRNANKYEAADIYSENSRLAETTVTPRIASLLWNVSGYTSGDITRPHHYSDSTSIWASRVDATPLALVSQKIYYKDSFDLNTIVTGCYDKSAGTDNQITKEQLKTYGITFRYEIPTTEYKNNVDNSTNQQVFASVTPEGIITSKTPAGVTDNEAVVGKEPIVRVMMVDTVRNKLVDERYLKVKWTLNELEPVQLADKNSTAVLSCEDISTEFTWVEFVNEVYAKLRDAQGLSQNKFKQIYGDNPTITAIGWTTNWNPASDTSADATGVDRTAIPTWQATTNENGDALVGTWTLSPDQIQTVYCNSGNDTKTFKAKVEFKSGMPSEYPDLWFEWNFTVTLPTLPSINGFYDQYWLDNQIGEAHDVLPVQFNTQLYNDIAAGTVVPKGGNLETYNVSNHLQGANVPYCVYFNNLMNAFTYELKSGVRQFIVKDVPECGLWDLQFRYEQPLTGYAPNYVAPASAFKSAGIWTEPAPYRNVWDAFGAYQLNQTPAQAAQLVWDQGHVSWCGNPSHKEANIYLDHNNPANQALLNPLAQTDIVGSDGTVTPERTHDKPVTMTVWATLNNYNYIPVLKYKIYLVAPLRINQTSLGDFQDGVVSGSIVDWTQSFNLTDFRGYLVANVADGSVTPSNEQNMWTESLWKYYEIGAVAVDEANIRYTFARTNNSLKIDNTLSYASSLTSQQISDETNGNIVLSMQQVGNNLIFKNNGGSNIEAKVKAYIPVTVKYGFGTLSATLEAWIYPHAGM